jgi:hypothetical protein
MRTSDITATLAASGSAPDQPDALREVEQLYQGGPEILLHKLMLDAALEEFDEWHNTFCATAGTDQSAYEGPERVVQKFRKASFGRPRLVSRDLRQRLAILLGHLRRGDLMWRTRE